MDLSLGLGLGHALYAVHALESVGLENHQILKKRAGSNVTTIKRVFLKSVKEK